MLWRHAVILCGFLLVCLGLGSRVVYLHVTERDFLQEQGDARSLRYEDQPAYRGVVYDRHGEPLAVSTPVAAIWIDPQRARLTEAGRRSLGHLLELPQAELDEALAQERRRFVYLKRRVPWSVAERVRQLHLPGVYLQREYRRYYPAGEIAAHVVGMTDVDDVGIEGVELTFEEHLRGEPGRKLVLRDRRGETVKNLAHLESPQFGSDLTLSLDLRLQYLAYRELKAAVESHQASSGSLVMLDARSGDIMALVNQPSYNPNDTLKGRRGLRNRAATDQYEPGSTVKPFTALAALESGDFAPDTPIDTAPGYFRVRNKLVEDPVNRGTITLTQALKKSSQVAIAKVALELPPRSVYDVLQRAGFGQYLGTGLPGESAGLLSDSQLDNPVTRATLAYGYGLASTPLQLAQAYLTLATGGVRLPLSLLRQDGLEGRPAGAVRVFDARQAAAVLRMLETVTAADGTAPAAAVPGFRVAGKTGTARKVSAAGYDDERHVALFAGLAPVSDPRFVMVVVINEPGGDARDGGAVAAPVFGRVASRALRLLGAEPDSGVRA